MDSTKIVRVGDYFYDQNKLLGSGSFGRVYLGGLERDPNQKVAIKVISSNVLIFLPNFGTYLDREIDIAKQLKHPNFVQLYDFQKSEDYFLILEFCSGGNLKEAIYNKKEPLNEERAVRYLHQIVEAFSYIEAKTLVDKNGIKGSMMHRDLKPENIFLHEDKIKIGDFGLAKIMPKNLAMMQTKLGTPSYMSPQLLMGDPYSHKCDVWSVGMIFYQMLFKKLPYIGNGDQDLFWNIMKTPLDVPRGVSAETERILFEMLSVDEDLRPTWSQLAKHDLFKKMK